MNKTTMMIRQFVSTVTSTDVQIEEFPGEVFSLEFSAVVSLEKVLLQLPKRYVCSTVGYFDGMLSVGICPKKGYCFV